MITTNSVNRNANPAQKINVNTTKPPLLTNFRTEESAGLTTVSNIVGGTILGVVVDLGDLGIV